MTDYHLTSSFNITNNKFLTPNTLKQLFNKTIANEQFVKVNEKPLIKLKHCIDH